MTQSQYIHLFKRRFEGTDKTNKLHEETAKQFLSVAYTQLMYDLFRMNYSELDMYAKSYNTVPVENDSSVNVRFSTLPVKLVQLPNNSQIRRVSPIQDKSNMYVLVGLDQEDTIRNLRVGLADGSVRMRLIGERLEYTNLPDEVTSVMMRLIPAFESFDEDDEIYLPYAKEDTFLKMAYSNYANSPDQDLKDDNSNVYKASYQPIMNR